MVTGSVIKVIFSKGLILSTKVTWREIRFFFEGKALLDKRICYIFVTEVEVVFMRAGFTAGDICIWHSVKIVKNSNMQSALVYSA